MSALGSSSPRFRRRQPRARSRAGIVEAGTGEPISGATVSLSPVQTPTSATAVATLRLLMNQTNVDGVFEISAVPGRWRVQVQKEGCVTPIASSMTVDVGGGTVSGPRCAIRIEGNVGSLRVMAIQP